MTADTASAPAHAKPRGIFPYTLSSEWTKLWTLRSTSGMLLATVVVTVGLAALYCGMLAAQWDDMPDQVRAQYKLARRSLDGVLFGQLAMAALGVLVVSAEYGTGMIRSTLSAVPQRLRVLAAKILVFTAVALIVGELTAFASFFTGQAFLATQGIAASLSHEEVLRAVIGAGLYLAATGVCGLAIAALVRNTAGALVATFAALFLAPLLATVLRGEWGDIVGKYLISSPGRQIMRVHTVPDALAPWVGYGIFWAWIAVIAAIAAWFFVRRDA